MSNLKLSVPKSLVIGWARYMIKMVKHPLVFEGKEVGAYCSPTRKEINIHDKYHINDQDILHRVVEEIAHAINDHLDIDDDDDERHHLLRQWVSAYIQFARNNIKFMRGVLDFLEKC